MWFYVLLSLCFLLTSPQSAQAAGEISLSPAIEKITIENPDQPTQYTMYVASNLGRPQQVVFEVVPVSSVDVLGKPLLDQSPGALERISQQVVLEPKQAMLLPQERIGVSVTIHPGLLPPGGTYALLTAKLEDKANAGSKTQASVVPVIASFLAIRNLNGEDRRIAIGGMTWPNLPITFNLNEQVEVSLENQGNVHVEPHGLVELTDNFNRLVSRGQLNENSHLIMPSQEKVLGVSMRSLGSSLPISMYALKTSGTDELGQNPFVSIKRFVYISPWVAGSAAVIGLLLLLANKYKDFKPFKRRKNRKINDLANRTSINDVLEILQPKQ
jgi:hypothetical protein